MVKCLYALKMTFSALSCIKKLISYYGFVYFMTKSGQIDDLVHQSASAC